jgi:hypothetical protein
MRKFFVVSALALGSVLVGVGTGSAAPPTTGPGTGNHPYFPLVCEGGVLEEPTPGFVVQANGASSTLPTGFFYPGPLEDGEPDLSVDPILGVVMFREFVDLDSGNVLLSQSRGKGNTLEKLDRRDDISVCVVPVPTEVPGLGEVLIRIYVKS